MEAKDHLQIAKMLYAMEQKRKKPDMADLMHNERYARTMSDEHPFVKPPRAGFVPVDSEQKRAWAALNKGKL